MQMKPRQWGRTAPTYETLNRGDHIVCVGRIREATICLEALIRRAHNVLLYGDRGVGKSFFVRQILLGALQRSDQSILVIPLRVTDLLAYSPGDLSAAFTRATLLAICTHIWTDLIGRSYLDLRESLERSGDELSVSSAQEKIVQRIYRQLMTSERGARFERSSSIGLSAGVVGNVNERRERFLKQSDLLPFEFFELLAELKQAVLTKFGKTRVVVLCDEANVLTYGQQMDLLERHIQLFADGRVQFLFVVGLVPYDRQLNLPRSFESQLPLEGLLPHEIHSILEAIETTHSIPFPLMSVSVLCELLDSNTRLVLRAAEQAEKLCIGRGDQEVSLDSARHVADLLQSEIERHEGQLMKELAPHDKHDQ